MPDPATGVVAGTSLLGAGLSANSANKASKAASSAEAASLGFAKQQYDDWLKIFGPIQTNLSNYYNTLSPSRIEAQGKEAIELERTEWISRIEENFAARGLTGSAMEGSALADVERQTAIGKANVAATAEDVAAQKKLGFLTLGYGQNPAGAMQNVLQSQAQSKRNLATSSAQAAGKALGSAISTTGTALSDYYAGGKQ